MKTNLIFNTLGALAFAGLSLTAASAHADVGRHERVYVGHADHSYQQSHRFIQKINARQDQQMDRIRSGMRSGQLTRSEFRELMHEQRDIRAMEQHFRADGHIDAREFRRLDHALNRASRHIKEERHDRQARYASNHHNRFN